MTTALALAREGTGRTSPNPAVGAVIVKDGETAGRGFHTWTGVDHAEVLALREAGERARGATLYVTLEPCSHQGRTPPCVDAVINSGIRRVVAAMEDPNPLVSGDGFRKLRKAGIEVELAAAHTAEAEKINEAFVHFMRTGRPLVTLKTAVTLDGKIAAPEDNRGWITSERARRHVQVLRHQSDAILTGIGTVLADDPRLNDRSGKERRTPLMSRIVTGARNDLLIVTTSAASDERRQALEARGIRVILCDGSSGRTDLPSLVSYLARERYLSLMIEAGSKINWAALDSGVVDKIFFYYAPKILGGLQSLPLAGGKGKRRRADAILFERVALHPIPPDEFAVEAYVHRDH
ncbi:MAG: bifunctional diaminohydroxyphosphoribosylaminopyrimidine deaminase/5-amino-6-(5-phosphoribosylamino)uracil reductase RibD [Acidobacteria bacterium]|nr:bifunctional diaminohydroxyphosphoribosylaminopyrimidine deaminase/5-amino-6-(5-phosphoribosylamino)uracil reductase RibD [Acidobacteriota bacterium]